MNQPSNGAIRVVVADKSPLVQAGLKSYFEDDDRFELLDIVANGEDFLEAAERHEFDVGIIGWDMPGQSGREVLQTACKLPHPPRIIIYTGNPAPEIPRMALQLGGAGFCSKSESLNSLVDTVVSVSDGRMVFPFMDIADAGIDPFSSLTARERELLGSLSSGSTNAQIAREMDISLNTVKFHLKNLYCKLAVKNRAQAVSCYLKSQGGSRAFST